MEGIDQILNEIENAARTLMYMSQNPFNNREQLKFAENVILNFQKSQLPINTCLSILEKSESELVLFETIKLIKNHIVYNWHGVTDEEKNYLRQTLLNYVINKPHLAISVREKVLQIISIIIKRNYIEDKGVEIMTLFTEIKRMIYSGNQDQQILSCLITISLLQEFANTIKSDDTCLTFEEHFKAKKYFEIKDLLAIFELILSSVEELIRCFNAQDKQHLNLMKYFLQILEIILTWGYVTTIIPRLIRTCETIASFNQVLPLRLNTNWSEIMLSEKTMEIFYFVYWKVREHIDLQPKALNCLIQLSTLNGSIFVSNGPESSFNYFNTYLKFYLELLKNIELQECEVFGFSLILRKLFVFHDAKFEFVKLEAPTINCILEKMLVMTVNFCENSIKEELSGLGSTNYTDAYKNMLEAWLEIIELTDLQPPQWKLVKDYTAIIFNKFIETHLSSHEKSEIESKTEVNEIEENDRTLYKEQLIIIGFFGRLSLEHALNTLAKLLEDKICALFTQLAYLQPNTSFNSSVSGNLAIIYEDIHWLLLIAGHVVCMESEGETPLIPKEINEYSVVKISEGHFNAQTSLTTLMNSNVLTQEALSFDNSKSDLVIRLISSVFRLCEIEKNSIGAGLGIYLSPLTSSTMMWFIKVFCASYLYIDPVYYSPLSEIYMEVLGVEKMGAKWALNYILEKICFNIHNYNQELEVVEDTLNVFLDIVNPKNQKLQHIVSSDHIQNLIQIKDVHFDCKIKRIVYKGLVLASNVFKEENMRSLCLDHILAPINAQYEMIAKVLAERGNAVYQETELRNNILTLLEEMTGVVEGSNAYTYEYIYKSLFKIYTQLPYILDLYHNYQEVTVAILKLLIESASISYIASENKKEILQNFNECCTNCLKMYFKHINSRNFKDLDENDTPDDIECIITLLRKIVLKNILQPVNDASDVTHMGIFILSNLLPAIYPILDKFPNICSAYYKTLNVFIESVVISSNELRIIPNDLLNNILYTIRIGLTSFVSSEVQNTCLDLLTTIGQAIKDDQGDIQLFKTIIVHPFLKLLFDIIFTLDLHKENHRECFSTIFILSVCDPPFFHMTMQTLLEEQREKFHNNHYILNSPEVSTLSQYPFRYSKDLKNKFVDLFEKFIANISILYRN